MGLKSRTLFARKGEGGLQEVRSFLRDTIGNNGDLILRLEGVLYQPDVVHLSIYYLDRPDLALRATSPAPGVIVTTGTDVNHISLLFSDKIETGSIASGSFTLDNIGLETRDVNVESNQYIARIRVTGSTNNSSGFHSLEIDSSKIKYTNGEFIQHSAVMGYNKANINAAYPGQEQPYSAFGGRRGDVSIVGVVVPKGSPSNEIISAFMRQAGVTQDRLIASTSVPLDNGNLYCFFIYFVTLEPQIIYYYPYNYSFALDTNAPSEVAVIFREKIDKPYITGTSGLFKIATSYNTDYGIQGTQITVEPDNKTVKVATSAWLTGSGIYDMHIYGVKSYDGTVKTVPDIYTLLVGQITGAGGGGIAGASLEAGTGLIKDATHYHVRPADPTVSGTSTGIRVGSYSLAGSHIVGGGVTGGNIAVGQVVKSISITGDTALYDNITLTGLGSTTVVGVGSTIRFSGIGLTGGISGISTTIDQPNTVRVVSADNTITVGIGGVRVGVITGGNIDNYVISGSKIVGSTITGGNIASTQVVKSMTIPLGGATLYDNITLDQEGTMNISVVGQVATFSGGGVATATSGVQIVEGTIARAVSSDSTVVVGVGGIRVGVITGGNIQSYGVSGVNIGGSTLTGGNIAAGNVVKSVNVTGSTSIYDNITYTGLGTITITSSSQTISFSGATGAGGGITGGVSGVETLGTTLVRVKAADSTILVSGGGINVGAIGTNNIQDASITSAKYAVPYPITGLEFYSLGPFYVGSITGFSGRFIAGGNVAFVYGASDQSITISATVPPPVLEGVFGNIFLMG